MSQTLVAAQKWERQDQSYGRGWTDMYWKTRGEPSRLAVVEALKYLEPFKSVMELGCNAGPQLDAIHQAYPKAILGGIDVNPQAIAAAKLNMPGASLHCQNLWNWLPAQPAGAWDVIVSHYTLAYVAPEDLQAILSQCWRVAGKGLVLAEPTSYPNLPPGLVYAYPEWRHDYHGALKRLGAGIVRGFPIEGPGHLNAITVGEKE